MKRIVVTIMFALSLMIAMPVHAQKTAAEWQNEVTSLDQQLKDSKVKLDAADAAARKAKPEEVNQKKQEHTAAVQNYNAIAAKLKTAKAELAKAQAQPVQAPAPQAAAPQAQEPVENNDPTPPVAEDTEVMADTTAAQPQAVDHEEETQAEEVDSALPAGWWKYLLAMLAISALFSGVVFFVLNKKIEELTNKLKAETQALQRGLNQRMDDLTSKTNRIETSVGSVRQDMRNRTAAYGPAPAAQAATQQYGPAQPPQPKRPTEFYLGIPGMDGTWREVKTVNIAGQSLYLLNSVDGVNGTFRVINEPGAVQPILMAVGKYLAPVCRVTNTATQVNGIVTDEPGTAVCENGVWRMTKKAVVHYV